MPSPLTSLVLAEEAALGVGERCRVTSAMAAAAGLRPPPPHAGKGRARGGACEGKGGAWIGRSFAARAWLICGGGRGLTW